MALNPNDPSWIACLTYDFVLWILSVVFDCFFREIRPRGAFRLPRTGPVVFVAAPHANQFVDPVILMGQVKNESNRRVSFLIADKSYKKRFIGDLAKWQLAIPVKRAQDNLNAGTGKISVDLENNPLIVRGVGTKFTQECVPRGLIALPQSLATTEIAEVVSDTELLLRKEFKKSDKAEKLLRNGTSFKKADKVDQKEVYNKVFEHLSNGQCLGIFPEGGSHDRTDLLPLKAGVAIMALGAMQNDPDCDVKIVPCGMNYFHPHKFRSRAVVEFGHPITIPKDLVKKYSNSETNREAVKELLDLITIGLKAVTVTCQDYETLMVVQAARRLYAGNFANKLPLPLIVEMNRRLVIGYSHFKTNPKIQETKEKIMKYNEMLRQMHLPDHQVEDLDESNKLRVLPVLLFRVLKLLVFGFLALPGATLFLPVFISAKKISSQKAKEALAGSTVKVKANDVIATWKILIGMGLAPLLYIFYSCVGTYYCYRNELFTTWRLSLIWVGIYIASASVTYAALIVGEQGMDIFKSLRPLYLSLTSGSSVRELKSFRRELSEEITEIVNMFGPEIFPNDFNLLEIKNKLKSTGSKGFVDSDEEEEAKTQELRKRRARKRALEKKTTESSKSISSEISTPSSQNDESELSLLGKSRSASFTDSDGISLMNSDNSLTNIPMFSDYHLHGARKRGSSSVSLSSVGNDYESSNPARVAGLELSLGGLSGKIRDKVFEGREKQIRSTELSESEE